MATKNPLEIKGVRDGLLVHVGGDQDWRDVVKHLAMYIDKQREFFRGASIALDVGERALRQKELGVLQHLLSERQVTLWAVLCTNAVTEATAHHLGLQTTLEPPVPEPAPSRNVSVISRVAETLLRVDDPDDATPPINPEEVGTPGVLLKRTLRSGRTVRSAGHVVVIGDVNPGAEVVAGGDVIVWGHLRGVVHAGAQGDENATVCALNMTPMQLRIAGHIATSPKDQNRKPRPEVAMVRDDRIVVEAWN